MLKIITTCILGLVSLACMNAQTEMAWSTYNIGFVAPPTMQTLVDSKGRFEASNDNVQISIFPWDGRVNFDDLGDGTIDIATQLGYETTGSADALELDDYQGFYVQAAKQGIEAIVVLLYNNAGNVSLVADIQYQPGFINEAMDIALSFYATN